MNKNIVIGILSALLVIGGAFAIVPNNVTPEPVVSNVEIVGKDGKDGKSIVGPKGEAGKDGKDGKDGTDAIVDINKLADLVSDELEDREDNVTFSFGGEGGDFSSVINISDADSYEFTIKHFGSEEIVVSIEDKDGNIDTIINTSGHISYIESRNLEEGDYIVRVSADGEWSIEIEEN